MIRFSTPKYDLTCDGYEQELHTWEQIVAQGIDINAKNANGYTPLYLAIGQQNRLEVIQYLLDQGADVNENCVLHLAIKLYCHSPEVLELVKLLIRYGADVNKLDCRRLSPLFVAVQSNASAEVICELLCNGAQVNSKSLLDVAINAYSPGGWDVINLLIRHGASVKHKNTQNQTPLHTAIQSGATFEVVQRLLKSGAKINAKDRRGYSPLLYAVQRIGTMIKSNKDFNRCEAISLDVFLVLLKYGADVNKANLEGNTPLHLVFENFIDAPGIFRIAVNSLMKCGALVCRKNIKGVSVVDLTTSLRNLVHVDVKEVILKYSLIECPIDIDSVYNDTTFRIYEQSFWDCRDEISKMKQHCIVGSLTLYDFVVLKSDYGKFISIETDIFLKGSVFLRQFRQEYPKYFKIILKSLETESYLFKKFCNLHVYSQRNSDYQNLCSINSYCLYHVSKYLSRRDIRNFFKAFNI